MFMVSRFFRSAGLVLAASIFVGTAAAQSPTRLSPQELKQGFINGRLLAQPKSDAKSGDLAERESHAGTHLHHVIKGRHTLRVLEFSKQTNVRQTAAQLQASGLYEYVEPDFIRHAYAVPNDPLFGSQNNLSQINAPSAWDTRRDASNIIVAIIDSGLRPTHEDLAGALWTNPGEQGFDSDHDGYSNDVHGINTLATKGTQDDGDISDNEGHGTAVASVIGAVANNGKGMSGVAWNVQLMPLKFNDATEVALSSNEIICINYAVAHGAKIINFSYGSHEYSQSEYDAIKAARDAGVIFVAAAGNDGAPSDFARPYPASYLLDNIVSVGNNDSTDALAGSSNYGGLVDLAAPGTNINVCSKDGDASYTTYSGTSFSAPTVAGALALLAAQYPSDNYRQLINRVLTSVDVNTSYQGQVATNGRLNLARALTTSSNRPYNDAFENAPYLPNYYAYTRASSKGATSQPNEPTHGAVGGASLWWRWIPGATGTAVADTAGSDFDTTVAVYTGTNLATLTQVASNDDAPGRTTSRVTFNAVAGQVYYIAIDGKNGATGEVALAVDNLPLNDNFSSAQDVTASFDSKGLVFADNRFATKESSESNFTVGSQTTSGNSLWYKWTAKSTGVRTVTSYSESFESAVAVYTGSSLSALTMTSSGFESATFNATANQTYYIKVDSIDTNLGLFILNINPYADATPLATEIYASPAADSSGNIAAIDEASVLLYLSPNGSGWENQLFQGSVTFNSPVFSPDGSFNVTSTTGLYNVSPSQTINWSQSYPGTSGCSSAPAIDMDGTLYVHSDNGILHAYNSHGIQIWSVSVPGTSMSSPAIGSTGVIYIGSDNHLLYAVNMVDGTVAWTFNAGDQIQASPAIDGNGRIYFGTLGNQFFCLNSDGSQAYTISTGGEIYSSAAITADGSAVFGSGDGKLYKVSKNQTIAFTYNTANGDGIYSSPTVLSDGSIIFGANDGQLYQISNTGTYLNSWTTGASILSSPVVSQGRIVFGGIDHEVYTIQNNATLASTPWPTFRGNSAHTGRVKTQQLAPVMRAVTPSQTYADGAQVMLRAIIDGAGPMTYTWTFNGNVIGVVDSSLGFNMGSSLAGIYTVTATNSYGSVTSAPIVVTEGAVAPPIDTGSGPGRIINLSARAYAGTGANTLIVGLVIGPGNGTKPILVRGVGPSLQARGVTTFIDDPALNLYSGSTVINSNDNWTTDLNVAALSPQVGAAAFTTAKDAALVANLTPGNYTAHVVNGANSAGAAGVALAEFYDGSSSIDSETPLLRNISARAHVGQGDQVLIVGFIIGGSTPVKVLIRGLGPQLTHQSVPNVIADPTMRLVNQADGSTVQTNDNWGDAINAAEIQATFSQVGATQLDAGSKDAAILTTLAPGAYTAVISGVNGATGVGLAELFQVP